MENFLKPFLEKGVGCSFRKVSMATDGVAESNIKLLQKVIFKHDVLVEFKEVLHLACSPESFTVRSDAVKKIIKRLSVLLVSDQDVKVKSEIFSNLFQCFATSCKGDENVQIVEFFIVLSIILGMNAIPNENTGDCLVNVENFQTAFEVEIPSSSSDSFIIFKELLLCLSKTSVNLNSPEIQSYNKWLQQLLKNVANSQPFQNIFLDIFLSVADIDLKLLEGNLDYVFSNILTNGCADDRNFWNSFGRFLENALGISAKFQRSVKFITKFLLSIKATSSNLVKELILPSNVINEFSKIVRVTSNQQSLSLLDVLLENISECFNTFSENGSGPKLLLLVTSELLISFFKEVKLYSPSTVASTLQTFINKLCVFKETLQKFGTYLFSNKTFISKNKDIVEMFLGLCFYCGEIQELVNCYKDSILQPSDMNDSNKDCDWQCCISSEQWDKLVNFVLKSKLENCSSVCFQLALQHLRICKLENKKVPPDDPSLKIILHHLTSDKFNTFQQLPPEDLPILMELLTNKQSKSVSKHILKQILEKQENKGETTVWLSSPTLQENSLFIGAFFSEVLTETGTILRSAVPEKNHPRLSWLSDEYFDEGHSIRGEILERLPENINDLLRNAKKMRKSAKLDRKDTLVGIVEVFKLLPLPYMKAEFRKLGLSFAVGVGTFLAEEESLVFESICNFLASDMDASTCFDIGYCIKWLAEVSSSENDLKVKVIESLVRNSPNMKFGLNQVGDMIDSAETGKPANPLKTLETRVVLYNELGKCWQRAKKRKSDNDLIGSYRTKLAKMISEEARQLQDNTINPGNCKILLKIVAIELNKAIKGKEEEEIANLAREKFPPYFDFAVKSLKKEFDEPSAAFLTFILQSLPQLRKFLPEESFLKIWKVLKPYEKVNWRLFCCHSNEDEFNEVLDDLLKMSKKFLTSEPTKNSSNCFEIWVSFFESSTESKRNSCQVRLQQLFGYVHECHLLLRDLPIRRKLCLIKFFSFCLTNKEVVITSHVLDTIIHVVLECLDSESLSTEDFHGLFTLEVEVASAVLLRQFAWSKSKVHLTFVIFKRMLGSLMARCNATQVVNKEDVIKLSACAFCLEKWTSLMVKREKDFARTSAYFITALISSIASVTVLPAVKFHLVNSINHFLSISDSHTVAYLLRILKPGYQQVFNTVYNQFKKYHKYSGKI